MISSAESAEIGICSPLLNSPKDAVTRALKGHGRHGALEMTKLKGGARGMRCQTVPTMYSPASYFYTTPNNTKVHYTSSGKGLGPIVLFLHGLGGSTKTFSRLLPYFPQRHHLVCVDLEGFGETPLNSPSTHLSFSRYVSDLHSLITHLQEPLSATTNGLQSSTSQSGARTDGGEASPKHKQVILVGHSLGSIISLHYAAEHADKVAGLLILGVGRSVAGIPAAQERMRALGSTAREQGMEAVAEVAVKTNFPPDGSCEEDVYKVEVRTAVAGCDPKAYALTAELIASDDHRDPDYSKITCPAVFVSGDQDILSPVQRSIDVSKMMGGRTALVVTKGGHQMILQDLKGVREAVYTLLGMIPVASDAEVRNARPRTEDELLA